MRFIVVYLRITVFITLRYFFHTSSCVKNLRKLQFYMKRLRHFLVKQNIISICLSLCFSCSLLFPCYCCWFVKGRLQNPWLEFISCLGSNLYIPPKELCDMHRSACAKLVEGFLSDLSHPLHNDLSKWHPHARTRPTLRSIRSRANIYRNWIFPIPSPNFHQPGASRDWLSMQSILLLIFCFGFSPRLFYSVFWRVNESVLFARNAGACVRKRPIQSNPMRYNIIQYSKILFSCQRHN